MLLIATLLFSSLQDQFPDELTMKPANEKFDFDKAVEDMKMYSNEFKNKFKDPKWVSNIDGREKKVIDLSEAAKTFEFDNEDLTERSTTPEKFRELAMELAGHVTAIDYTKHEVIYWSEGTDELDKEGNKMTGLAEVKKWGAVGLDLLKHIEDRFANTNPLIMKALDEVQKMYIPS